MGITHKTSAISIMNTRYTHLPCLLEPESAFLWCETNSIGLYRQRTDIFGVSILLPYTDEDKKSVHGNALAQERKANALVRAQALREKIRSGGRLTTAERVFKSRHRELFHEERLSDEPVR